MGAFCMYRSKMSPVKVAEGAHGPTKLWHCSNFPLEIGNDFLITYFLILQKGSWCQPWQSIIFHAFFLKLSTLYSGDPL